MLFDADALVNFHVKQLYHNNVMFFFWGVAQEIVSLLLVWTNLYIYKIHVDIDTVLFTGKESNDDMPGPTKFTKPTCNHECMSDFHHVCSGIVL